MAADTNPCHKCKSTIPLTDSVCLIPCCCILCKNCTIDLLYETCKLKLDLQCRLCGHGVDSVLVGLCSTEPSEAMPLAKHHTPDATSKTKKAREEQEFSSKNKAKAGINDATEETENNDDVVEEDQKQNATKSVLTDPTDCGTRASSSGLSQQDATEESEEIANGAKVRRFKKFEERFEELLSFKEEYGHMRVGLKYKSLRDWLRCVRRGRFAITSEQRKMLNDIGFIWNPMENKWNQQLEKLKAYHRRFGHCFVPSQWSEDEKFADFANRLRKKYDRGEIRPERRKQLELLGFGMTLDELPEPDTIANESIIQQRHDYSFERTSQMNSISHQEQDFYSDLVAESDRIEPYIQEHELKPNCETPTTGKNQIEPQTNGQHLNNSDEEFENSKLNNSTTAKDQVEPQTNGQHMTNSDEEFENPELNNSQNCKRKEGSDKDDCSLKAKRKQLNEKSKDDPTTEKNSKSQKVKTMRRFEDRIEILLQFKQEHGHLRVNKRIDELHRGTWMWVNRVRHGRRKLSDEQRQKLTDIGFEWECGRKTFEERIQQLKVFKKKHGHLRVPYDYEGNNNLSRWIARIRSGQIEITREHRKTLDGLGFIWETLTNQVDRLWQEKLEQLKEFKDRFGHCMVPYQWSENKSLHNWVHKQRNENTAGILRPDRKQQLEEIGFYWQGQRFTPEFDKNDAVSRDS